ncbi:MAG: T9SS type A sorting domain-containing protein [Sphingobacteriaceae bacterium]|nr:T9SS type A sorting domain-containing protein [Sphingobacteriaceae bacterium]
MNSSIFTQGHLKAITIAIIFFFAFHLKSQSQNSAFLFTENKGQVSDQNHLPQTDVLFGGKSGHLVFHLKKKGFSYQLDKVLKWKNDDLFEKLGLPTPDHKPKLIPEKSIICRVDVSWLNVSALPQVLKEKKASFYANYYLPVCPQGVHEVSSYEEITYKNIYNGIDVKWHGLDGKLKYDYLIEAGANPHQIQLKIEGAESIHINSKGELIIKTAAGIIVEEKPIAYQNGKTIACSWKLNGNIVSYDLNQYNTTLPLIIDPGVRMWGTYYGGNDPDVGWGISCDSNGNVYQAGYAVTQGGTVIATSGSHQVLHGGGYENAFLAKFNTNGVRLWATYYGGSVRDLGMFCAVDPNDNVYMSGHTLSSNPGVIATPGSHQPNAGGDWDGYLVKFNSAGVRQWGTYYGGPTIEFGVSCAAAKDGTGDVYLCGKTQQTSGTVIATPGSFQSFFGGQEDAYLVKFNSAGVRQWGTYYGLEGTDQGNHVATDSQGYIYLLGNTSSTAGIATPGAYQTNYVFDFDAFLVKFNNSGIRQWGTYYGGNGDDRAHGFARDPASGALYIGGRTSSTNSISTDGSHQPVYAGGNWDGFLVKLNSTGSIRDWGTYYGGSAEDLIFSCAISNLGYPYIIGYAGTTSTSLASVGSHQPNHGGGLFDAVIAQFNTTGVRLWASYYGGNGYDVGQCSATDSNSNVYLGGLADAAGVGVISTAGAHQSVFGGGGTDAFLVKFYDCSVPDAPTNFTPFSVKNTCLGSAPSLTVSSLGSVNWYTVPSGGTSIFTGSIYPTGTLNIGVHNFYAEAFTCTNSAVRVPVSVTVNPLPNLNITSSNTMLCIGASCYLFASGVTSHTWNTGSNSSSLTISPTVNTTYTVNGTDINGCIGQATFEQSVTICVSINKLDLNENVLLYPNPFQENIQFENLPINSTITIYNLLGEIIIRGENSDSRHLLDTQILPSGIYLLSIENKSYTKVFRVIKN